MSALGAWLADHADLFVSLGLTLDGKAPEAAALELLEALLPLVTLPAEAAEAEAVSLAEEESESDHEARLVALEARVEALETAKSGGGE